MIKASSNVQLFQKIFSTALKKIAKIGSNQGFNLSFNQCPIQLKNTILEGKKTCINHYFTNSEFK